MIYHVSIHGNDKNTGASDSPFRTINRAAQVAVAGDIVRVHGGTYREWVDPKRGGLNENTRIVYEAVEGETPVIKGSEVVTDWERVAGTVWKKVLPNSMFGDFNPFAETVRGDWFRNPHENGYDVHLGDVYVGGQSMYEASSMDDLFRAEMRSTGWGKKFPFSHEEKLGCPEKTVYRWYAEVTEDTTTVWGNFQALDPNRELIEINVRPCCFYPTETGINYITLRGFEIAQAASGWAPPTADQVGMVGPHWAKGWIIENNHLHDAKCCAVSIGKESSTGDNLHTNEGRKSGYQYQMEAVFLALRAGWCKEMIGSHVIRNNTIHDCGQCAIVGHLGCAFSRIEHNHIYNIAKKMEFWGHEIGGIKLHAPLDVVIENNHIHDCTLGTWLDWQVQGMRITRNIYHRNDRDLMIEVTHGPCLVDNNLFLSDFAFQDAAQGTAYVHNLINGYTHTYPVRDRSTPYHFPHTTQIAGCSLTLGGDHRVYNNLLLGKKETSYESSKNPYNRTGHMGEVYDLYSSPDEYPTRLQEQTGDHTKYHQVPQPVWVEENVYAGYARPFRAEKNPILTDGMSADVREENGKWILTLSVPAPVTDASCRAVTTARLGAPRITEEPYENPDGTPIDFTRDFLENHRADRVIPGPFATLSKGENRIVIWED